MPFGQVLALSLIHLGVDHIELPTILLPNLIDDGRHLFAVRAIGGAKVHQDGTVCCLKGRTSPKVTAANMAAAQDTPARKARLLGKGLAPWSLFQQQLDLLLECFESLGSHQTPDLFSGFVEKDVGGLTDETLLPGQLFPAPGVDVDTHDVKILAVGLFKPIYDRRHLLADGSPLRIEVEHAGTVFLAGLLRTSTCGEYPSATDQEKGDQSDDSLELEAMVRVSSQSPSLYPDSRQAKRVDVPGSFTG
jgi:hypothetical protein